MRYLFLFLALLLVAPTAFAQKPTDDKPEDGLLGTWEYTVRPDDPIATGTFELEESGDQLNGMFNTNEPRKMENIELMDSGLSFTFTQPGMGLIVINLTLEDGSLFGDALQEGADEPLPMVAVRPDPDSDSSED